MLIRLKNKFIPRIAITMGDPAGIGPEIILKCLNDKTITSKICPLIIGDFNVFKRMKHFVKTIKKIIVVDDNTVSNQHYALKGRILFINSDISNGMIEIGRGNKASGFMSYKAVTRGIQLCMDKSVDAMVTAPISKEAWHEAKIFFPGHTELLAKMTKTKRYSMMFIGGVFRVILVTIHEPLSRVHSIINVQKVIETCITGNETLKKYFNISRPRIACAGLNPHAGENGIFGKEEITIIKPAISKLKKKGINIKGPFPADTLFTDKYTEAFDLFVCMYHDQGLIPFKMRHFNNGVNITAGLPIIRTSPDHGTAFSIAGKNVADPHSMRQAILTAREMVINSRC
ncbi:MAG: 4-hydroxythreonine-4-phosphate dehydrogenase PdxA [candidate division FCPU426 bacterium]